MYPDHEFDPITPEEEAQADTPTALYLRHELAPNKQPPKKE